MSNLFPALWRSILGTLAPAALIGFALVAAAQAADPPGSAELPLEKVVLFSSGVGFFEREGRVEGDAQVELKFRVDDVNDLLKSMVVQDRDGGQIAAVGYGSKDPVTKTLQSFAIDLTEQPTLAELLAQVRGQQVELEAPNLITAVILGVEKREQKAGDDEVIEIDVLNLLSDEGLMSVPLDSVRRIRLVDKDLDGELRKALAVLASSQSTDKKTVTLDFRGEGKRSVRVGYIRQTPVWKTSYRLVLEDEKAPLVQGWAIVENTTEEDWGEIDLTLISGRPISFVMDLYEPLYVPRPVEELELYASLRPPSYDQDLARHEVEFRRRAAAGKPAEPEVPQLVAGLARAGGRALGQDRYGAADLAAAAEEGAEKAYERWNFQQGVEAAATAGEVGELFRYDIEAPVSLPRQQSAMLPIVNSEVKAEKVSIYNPRVHAKHPLNGLWLTNSTDLHLMQGPVTVLDDGVYAGDAKIDDMPPETKRLVSYALDLDVEVAPESKGRPTELLSVRLVKGTMIVTQRHQRVQEYTVKNSGQKPRSVLIEYPYDSTWELVTPAEPAEKTRDLYRFRVEAPSGEPAGLTVEEERTDSQEVALTNISDGSIRIYLSAKVVSDEVKAALQRIVEKKHEIDLLAESRKQLEKQIAEIGSEQARIRENMARLDRNSELYNRYVKKFSDQEDEIERMREKILELTDRETELRKALDEYLMGLELQ